MQTMNIPIELLVFALSNGKVNALRLFINLKSQGSGYVDWTPEQKERILLDLNIKSPKTINTNLKWLLKKGWVTMNNKRVSIRVVGYLVLAKKLNFQCATGVICENQNFNNFRPFIYAAVITYYLNSKYCIARQSARKKGSVMMNWSYRNLPAKYLAEVMCLGKSTIIRYRQEAWDAGYIKMKYMFKPVHISIQELKFYRAMGDPDSCRLVIHENQTKFQLPNEIISNLKLRTKQNLKRYINSRK